MVYSNYDYQGHSGQSRSFGSSQAMRETLRVGPGDTLEIESDDDRLIVSPVRQRADLQKEQGVWVYRSGTPTNTSLPDLVEQQRNRRAEELIGNRP